MDYNEMYDRIKAKCDEFPDCVGCPLFEVSELNCYTGLTHEQLEYNYYLMFPEDKPQEVEDTAVEMVNHPSHYQNGSMECIDEMVLLFGVEATKHFCLLNAWKYRYRQGKKNGENDLDKANWYIQKYKSLVEGESLV